LGRDLNPEKPPKYAHACKPTKTVIAKTTKRLKRKKFSYKKLKGDF